MTTTTKTRQIGDLVYVYINNHRGISLGKLVSHHDETSWDVDLNAYSFGEDAITTVVPETDILDFDPYEGAEENDEEKEPDE